MYRIYIAPKYYTKTWCLAEMLGYSGSLYAYVFACMCPSPRLIVPILVA